MEGLSNPEGLCNAGYYCNGSVNTPIPSDSKCPSGHYCPEGSYAPLPCPTGSFSNAAGNRNKSDCRPCSPGRYCNPNDSIVLERECTAGYLCILGK